MEGLCRTDSEAVVALCGAITLRPHPHWDASDPTQGVVRKKQRLLLVWFGSSSQVSQRVRCC